VKESKTGMDNWMNGKSIDDLFDKNIKALLGKSYSPFMFIEQGKSPLHQDTIFYLETIININKKGFLTLDSQPSLFEELYCKYFGERKYQPNNNPQIDKNDIQVIRGKNFHKCHLYQKSYCSGWIYRYQLMNFKNKIEQNYKLFYYDDMNPEILYNDEKNTKENLTYFEFQDRIYHPTNFFGIKSSFDYTIKLLRKDINDELFQKFKQEMIFIMIIDTDYNTQKNIYQDILNCL
jgi:hypothetical protein